MAAHRTRGRLVWQAPLAVLLLVSVAPSGNTEPTPSKPRKPNEQIVRFQQPLPDHLKPIDGESELAAQQRVTAIMALTVEVDCLVVRNEEAVQTASHELLRKLGLLDRESFDLPHPSIPVAGSFVPAKE